MQLAYRMLDPRDADAEVKMYREAQKLIEERKRGNEIFIFFLQNAWTAFCTWKLAKLTEGLPKNPFPPF
ncbi:hypothetical protein GPALN_003252 [Globodera pallida]|nr:hypothetical protein GPALN_003252 [Globodera pallida]